MEAIDWTHRSEESTYEIRITGAVYTLKAVITTNTFLQLKEEGVSTTTTVLAVQERRFQCGSNERVFQAPRLCDWIEENQ